MKYKDSKNKLDNILNDTLLFGRAAILLPYLVGRVGIAMIGEELRGAYYRTFKIPHTIYESDHGFNSYIRLDK